MVLVLHSKGPSQKEWEENREIITRLYNATTAAHVQELMIRRGFRATGKMYKTHFKKWGLSKYTKASEKERRIQAMRELNPILRPQQTLPKLNDREMRKLIRYMKKMGKLPLSSERWKNKHSNGLTKKALTTLMRRHSADGTYDNSESTESRQLMLSKISNCCTDPHIPSHCHSLQTTSFVHTTTNGSVDMYLLFQSVQKACMLPPPPTQSHISKVFWGHIKQAIYLLRISSSARAWSTLNDAYSLANAALQTANTCTFAREILATLSPVNTRSSLDVRQQIVGYLADMSVISIGPSHPITVILRQLCSDEQTRDVSEKCLAFMADLAEASHDQQLQNLKVDAQLSISRLLRKDGEYESAMGLARSAHLAAVNCFGPNSIQAVSALRQQEHIFTDMGSYIEGLNICFSVINLAGSDMWNRNPGPIHESIIYTMEDIAQIYESLGNYEARGTWLRRAVSAAQSVWGDSVATSHIVDKLIGTVA
ncbi:hypothetical protein BP6252_08575 [Coleophoma cylindrospora]|uniref:Clr5 domain-containing protein n=1 Tax=Coleophoma cylindrospora TaxID=1849047 RepID=A0A3D8R686_9HELO|nr:hypothetical protein BP6252_08575 [Coleophoma cylindrospora]